ncbi:MAG: LptE family protein [Bacteroidota bacterium]
MKKEFYILILALFIGGTIGCTVNYSMGGASIEPDVETITIESIPNRAPSGPSGMSQLFTNDLKDKFQSQTSLEFVDNRGDLEFSGEITDYSTKPQAVGGDEKATKTRLTITVHIKFTNNKYPDKSYETDFSQYEDFDSSQSLSDVEDQLLEDISEKIIDDIFNKAVVNW